MKKVGLALFLLQTVSSQSFAGANPEVQIALDCRAHDEARDCSTTYESCADIQYEYAGTGDYDIGVVIYDLAEVNGVTYAIQYSGLQDAEFVGFTGCVPHESRTLGPDYISIIAVWGADCPTPLPGAGILLGWLHLRGGPGTIEIIPCACSDSVEVVDCSYQVDDIPPERWHAGFVGGANPGPGSVPPCGGTTPVSAHTWGTLKRVYQ
jgi:hypothetical protein